MDDSSAPLTEYRVEELAERAGVRVDTVRYYQAQRLLPPPERRGRIAVYDPEHLDRLRRIRALRAEGFTLAVIKRLLDREDEDLEDDDGALLEAVASEVLDERMLTREELARETGVPRALIRAAEMAGLVSPVRVDGEDRYGEAELEMARAGLALLDAGFPMHELLGLAVGHARNVRELTDAAIDLFDRHIRKTGGHRTDPLAVRDAFETLFPLVTRLVAIHFQRTLVTRALDRLERSDDSEALSASLEAIESGSLQVAVDWR